MKTIDITVPISPDLPVWPGDPSVQINTLTTIESDQCHLSAISMSLHTGTHIDAPLHYIEGGLSIDQMPLEAMIGKVRVIEVSYSQTIGKKELNGLNLQTGERILFKTRNSLREWWKEPFNDDYVYLLPEAAQLLVNSGIQTLGIDYLSVGGMGQDGIETHQILLQAGIWIIEGLNLTQVEPGDYELMSLPLKIIDRDGAPARAVLKTL